MTRTRDVEVVQANVGAGCDPLQEFQECNIDPCYQVNVLPIERRAGSLPSGLAVQRQVLQSGTPMVIHTGKNNWKLLPNGHIVPQGNPTFGLTVSQNNLQNGNSIILHEGDDVWSW